MKKLLVIAVVIVALTAIGKALEPVSWESLREGELRGTVIQSVESGMLVDGVFKSEETDGASNPIVVSGTFFLTGYGKEAYENSVIEVKAYPNGSYTYTTVLGGSRTVRAVRVTD